MGATCQRVRLDGTGASAVLELPGPFHLGGLFLFGIGMAAHTSFKVLRAIIRFPRFCPGIFRRAFGR